MFVIYALVGADGAPFYIGKTNDPSRRASEHKRWLGFLPKYVILEECGADWQFREHEWIEHFRSRGVNLLNRTAGGDGLETHTAASRALLSKIGRGRPKPTGFGEAISQAQRGIPKCWSAEGAERVSRNQFRSGENSLDRLSLETRIRRGRKISVVMAALPSEERSRRNVKGWAALSESERAARGKAIADGQRATGRVAERNRSEEARAASGRGSRQFWASMTAEERQSYLARRSEARRAANARRREAKA